MAQTANGAALIAANKLGVTLEQYNEYKKNGFKHCMSCRQWKVLKEFNRDNMRWDNLCPSCRNCRNKNEREKYVPIPIDERKPLGPPEAKGRDGDKKQARARVNKYVKKGKLLNPNDIACADCQHLGEDKRHEYDHYMGYNAEYHLVVQALCTSCHSKREWNRILEKRKIIEIKEDTQPVQYKLIKDFSGYRVGTDGSVWSCLSSRGMTEKWKIKATDINSLGYKRVTLYNDNGKRRVFLHRLVLETFVGPPPTPKHQGCHNDNNRSNNKLSNLRWDTPSNNSKQKYF